jgi:hypothetical protein
MWTIVRPRADARNGSFASLTRFSHVRFYPNSDRFAGIPKVSRWADFVAKVG